MMIRPPLRAAVLVAALVFAIPLAAKDMTQEPLATPPAGIAEATFASGCFWCGEKDFEGLPGVTEVISGYTGGRSPNPTYAEVGTNRSVHYEAIRVRFDPKKVTYDAVLEHFWHHVDYTDGGGQFCDRGDSYRPAIFVHDEQQRTAAEASKAALAASKGLTQPIPVPILPVATFTPAENYHQDYYKKNPVSYAFYRKGCGRDARLQQLWPERTSH
jgi:peptide-methionine (S)-S-oxide reductase